MFPSAQHISLYWVGSTKDWMGFWNFRIFTTVKSFCKDIERYEFQVFLPCTPSIDHPEPGGGYERFCYIHTYIHTYIHIYILLSLYICIHIYIYIYFFFLCFLIFIVFVLAIDLPNFALLFLRVHNCLLFAFMEYIKAGLFHVQGVPTFLSSLDCFYGAH